MTNISISIEKTLPGIDFGVFIRNEKARFGDIGCAPGGLCKYMTNSLAWKGIGFSLDIDKGGIQMKYTSPKLTFQAADIALIDGYVKVGDAIRQFNISCGEDSEAKLDFLNLGVVIGQHQIAEAENADQTALDLMNVARNSFLIMFEWLKPGGTCLWIFAAAHVGPYFYFLKRLESVFSKGLRAFSTLVPSRSPAYCLCRDFQPDLNAEWHAELLEDMKCITTERISRWCVTNYSQISELIDRMKPDMHKIWKRQQQGLEDIRREAEAKSEEQKEFALLKLGGHEGNALPDDKQKPDADGGWKQGLERRPNRIT